MYPPKKNVYLEQSVLHSNPHQLISLLLSGARSNIAQAINAIKRKDIQAKATKISKTIYIIQDGLQSSLNHKQGGDIAVKLEQLYSYSVQQLVRANCNNDISYLNEVDSILLEIESGWKAIPV